MLKAVIFDLDGVITDSAIFHYQAWKELALKLAIPFDEAYNEKLKGVSRMESLDLLLANGNQQNCFTAEQKEEMAHEKNENYKVLIQQIKPSDCLPGIKALLQDLKKSGIKAAVASVSKNATFILNQLKLSDSFDYVVDPEEIKNAKPFPDIFLKAAEALGVTPEECIGIEDAQAGIEAIKRAGMKAVGVGTKEQMYQADVILSRTSQLNIELLNCLYSSKGGCTDEK